MRDRRDQRGLALPSPVVLLTAAALILAAVAFVVTRGHGSGKVELATQTTSQPGVSASPSAGASSKAKAKSSKSAAPVKRSTVKVVVYNNTNIKGLAASVGAKVAKAGWQLLGAQNWQGTVPATTVYYGTGLKAAGKLLGLDLGISRVVPRDPAATGMITDGLTVILLGPLS